MLQLKLNRVDYHQVATTSHKCMRIMPSSNRDLQKVIIGDSTGVVQLFSVKNREPAPIFKTSPSKRISRIELAGKFGTDYDRIFAVCRRVIGHDADAADAAQEAMIAIVRGLAKFDGRSSFSTWTYRIATNASLDELRRRQRRPMNHLAHKDNKGNG